MAFVFSACNNNAEINSTENKSQKSEIQESVTNDNTTNKLDITNSSLYSDAPTGMIINDTAFDEWVLEKKCMLFPFMGAEGFSFSIPFEQSDSDIKTCTFSFKDGDITRTLKDVEFYYCVKQQQIMYAGFHVPNENIFTSKDFREACIRLMLGYNSTYDSENDLITPNISRERAEEIVDYCLQNKIKCIVDNMRIRVIERYGDKTYSFEIEY